MGIRSGNVQRTFTLSGLWIAAIGFFVTRFTVTLAHHESRIQFLVAGVVPLVLGLLLAACGVALLVGSFDHSFVRSVAVWCFAGTLAMAILVALTLVGTGPSGVGDSIRSEVVLSNFLIGGGLLGALTGLFAGQNRRSRSELHQQANRLETINRLLRHEVLNAIAVIRGRAETLASGDDRSTGTESAGKIIAESDRITATVDDVKHLARSSSEGLGTVDLVTAVDECVDAVRAAYPSVAFAVDAGSAEGIEVWADDQLAHALYPLVENAAAYSDGDEPVVTIDLAMGGPVACVRITDSGPGLPAEHRETLEAGTISNFDDPGTGFGINLARLFVEGYGGDIDTEVTEAGTTVEVELTRATEPRPSPTGTGSMRAMGVDQENLLVAAGAALLAGGVMGLFVQATAGVIPVIGALYGVSDPLVGWITHEFHSVVFGLIYAGFLAGIPASYADRPSVRLGVGIAWAFSLWLFAAGFIMPLWLNLVGINAPVPLLTPPALGGHFLWGLVLGATYHVGISWLDGRLSW